MKEKNITIRDVAKKAGVSVSTVSRAFNDYSDINEKTREKILKIAREIGYSPSVFARAMRANQNNRVGMAIEDYNESASHHSFLYKILMGFKEHVLESGYEMVLLPNMTKQYGSSKLSQIMRENHLDGVFIMGLKLSDEFYKEVQKGEFPCVLFDIPIAIGKTGYVGVDNKKGVALAVEHFIKKRHKKIAFINGHKDAHVSFERLDGYYLSLVKNDLTVDKSLIYYGDFTEESGRRGVKELFKAHKDITAIFAASDLMAMGAIKELKEMKINVPEDVEVIGFDDIELSSHITPPLSTVRQDTFRLGKSAATLLINIISGQSINQAIIEPQLILRGSTK